MSDVHLPALLVDYGYQASTKMARKSIDAGAVRIDGLVVLDYDLPHDSVYGHVLQVGSTREIKL